MLPIPVAKAALPLEVEEGMDEAADDCEPVVSEALDVAAAVHCALKPVLLWHVGP